MHAKAVSLKMSGLLWHRHTLQRIRAAKTTEWKYVSPSLRQVTNILAIKVNQRSLNCHGNHERVGLNGEGH